MASGRRKPTGNSRDDVDVRGLRRGADRQQRELTLHQPAHAGRSPIGANADDRPRIEKRPPPGIASRATAVVQDMVWRPARLASAAAALIHMHAAVRRNDAMQHDRNGIRVDDISARWILLGLAGRGQEGDGDNGEQSDGGFHGADSGLQFW